MSTKKEADRDSGPLHYVNPPDLRLLRPSRGEPKAPPDTTKPKEKPGSDLLSHAVTSTVPSALEGLTALFGMGRGVAPPELPPGTFLVARDE